MKKLLCVLMFGSLFVGCSTEPETQEVSIKVSRTDTFINTFKILVNGDEIYNITECVCDLAPHDTEDIIYTDYVGEPNKTDCILNDGYWGTYEDNNNGAEECEDFTDYFDSEYGYEYIFNTNKDDNISVIVSGKNTCEISAHVAASIFVNNVLIDSEETFCDGGSSGCMCNVLYPTNW